MSEHPIYRIAVTGCDGQLGREFIRLSKGYPRYDFIFLNRETFPLEDSKKMEEWLTVHPVDYFIHCAAYTLVDKAETEKEKAFAVNAVAPGLIAARLALNKTPFIYISTDYVFDGLSSSPLDEGAPTHPINTYGASKLEGERVALQNNPATLVIRTSWLYSTDGNNFVKTMIRLMKENGTVRVVQDQTGSPTYTGDLANAVLKIIGSAHFIPGIYHFSNEGETSWFGFAMEIRKLTGIKAIIIPIPSLEFPTPARRPAYSLLDKSKIKQYYGLLIPDWRSSLATCINILNKQGV